MKNRNTGVGVAFIGAGVALMVSSLSGAGVALIAVGIVFIVKEMTRKISNNNE